MEGRRVPYPPAKWAMDKGISLFFLVLFAPFFAIAFVAMWVGNLLSPRDRGPSLYREPRVSRGRRFDLLKFRVLTLSALKGQHGGEAHARLLEQDPENLTWAGRHVLKRWYLDELPQLVNVLRGDMSLVGPRPWPPSMVERQVAEGLDYRLRALPGWTGPVQVQKGVVEPEGYTALDLAYVEACRTWSGARLLRYDLGILWRTVRVLARGEGLTY
jgi:lipopolysaccharide/colanic/teichoic acid biosynthesis glycosyltransferase